MPVAGPCGSIDKHPLAVGVEVPIEGERRGAGLLRREHAAIRANERHDNARQPS